MRISAKAGAQVLEVEVERENGHFEVQVDGVPFLVDAQKLEGDFYSILVEGRSYEVSVMPDGDAYLVRHGATAQRVELSDPSRRARENVHAAEGPEKVITLMPGKVVRILVNEGDEVQPGQGLVVVEAMKMENEIATTKAGRVTKIEVKPGQTVEGNAVLAIVE